MLKESCRDVDPTHPSTRKPGASFHWAPSPPAAAAGAALPFAARQQRSHAFHVKAVIQKKKREGYFFLQTALKFTGRRGSRRPTQRFLLGLPEPGKLLPSELRFVSWLLSIWLLSGTDSSLRFFSGQHRILLKFLPPTPTPVFSIIKRLEIFA